jgi:hypothetical protein
MARLITTGQLERANRLLVRWLADQRSVRLGQATRELDRLDQAEPVEAGEQRIGHKVAVRLVSTLLRKAGFHKSGYTGSGYDREPVYARPMGPIA